MIDRVIKIDMDSDVYLSDDSIFFFGPASYLENVIWWVEISEEDSSCLTTANIFNPNNEDIQTM